MEGERNTDINTRIANLNVDIKPTNQGESLGRRERVVREGGGGGGENSGILETAGNFRAALQRYNPEFGTNYNEDGQALKTIDRKVWNKALIKGVFNRLNRRPINFGAKKEEEEYIGEVARLFPSNSNNRARTSKKKRK
eukprot:1746394-Rhodomonas_salina.2